jgi:flagellum-specific peptidoglycan hydrolase FlgJ
MPSARTPKWQQVTALVSLSATGAIAGFSFVPRAAADLASPTGMPIHLLALKQAAQPAPADDALVRSAIVNVAHYYLRMANGETPAEMDATIWQNDSIDGVDHGESCAAFASLTLELAAQVVGQQSWVTGGTSYPWPLHKWADVRVDPNPASPGVTSVLQDAEAHHRWHPLDDGYEPLPGDWVLFGGHVEVVTKYADGVLHTIGSDSLPNLSVNAHEYRGPLRTQGVAGFVNNGVLPGAANKTPHSHEHKSGGHRARGQAASGLAAIPGASAVGSAEPAPAHPPASATVPAAPAPAAQVTAPSPANGKRPARRQPQPQQGRKPTSHGHARSRGRAASHGRQSSVQGAAAIPGLSTTTHRPAAAPPGPGATPHGSHQPSPAAVPAQNTTAQQAFIGEVVPGAVAAQRRYGVPAAVTIAQAIDESAWGQSMLAAKDHNLFGIKGTGPAGSDPLPTQEYENGRPVTVTASFRIYHNFAESIDDHGKLLATSGFYTRAMADRQDPNAFATALTGVYATDPDYGTKLIGLMRGYDLYRYDLVAPAAPHPAAAPHQTAAPHHAAAAHHATATHHATAAAGAAIPGLPAAAPTPPASTSPSAPAPGATRGSGRQPGARRPASKAMPSTQTVSAKRMPAPVHRQTRRVASGNARTAASQYQQHIPQSVRNAFLTTARTPLIREEPLYRDVASHSGIRWELLAACDWMQCKAQPRFSPVHGEKLGTVNPGGTIYRTKSEALERCADDLVELARTVYRIDLTAAENLSVRDLANVFAAFRWGGLLRLHHTSAMEFPYSVAGLTAQHINMRWPNIADPNAPDKPGGRFRMPFGAVPVVLGLDYPATV